jgi:hypothetical protein
LLFGEVIKESRNSEASAQNTCLLKLGRAQLPYSQKLGLDRSIGFVVLSSYYGSLMAYGYYQYRHKKFKKSQNQQAIHNQ